MSLENVSFDNQLPILMEVEKLGLFIFITFYYRGFDYLVALFLHRIWSYSS